MARKMGVMGVLVAGFMALSSLTAWASTSDALSQASGNGQTPESASFGFNVDANGAGELTYTSDPSGENPGFWAQCDSFTSAYFGYTKVHGWPIAIVTGTCTDQDGNTVYLRASFVDRGEPGTRDSVCILWSYSPKPKESNAYVHDMGKISAGDIQILP